MPGTGRIAGKFSFPCIKFTKRMPVCYGTTLDGMSITMRDYLREHGDRREREIPHMPIFYEGEFLSQSQARGIWMIKTSSILLQDGRVAQIPEARGSWDLERSTA